MNSSISLAFSNAILNLPSKPGIEERCDLVYMSNLFHSFHNNGFLDNDYWRPLADEGFYHFERAKHLHEMFLFEGDYFEQHLGEHHVINFRIPKNTLKELHQLLPRFFSRMFNNEMILEKFMIWLES